MREKTLRNRPEIDSRFSGVAQAAGYREQPDSLRPADTEQRGPAADHAASRLVDDYGTNPTHALAETRGDKI